MSHVLIVVKMPTINTLYTAIMPAPYNMPSVANWEVYGRDAVMRSPNSKTGNALIAAKGNLQLEKINCATQLQAHALRVTMLEEAQQAGVQITNSFKRCVTSYNKHKNAAK